MNCSLIPTADEAAMALAGATGASIVLGAWFLAAGYAMGFLAVVFWKATR